MELGFTILLFIFIYIWFSNYNFMSFILLLLILNMGRNVRLYMIENNIINSQNPFLNSIKYIYNGISWIGSKIFNTNNYLSNNILFIRYFNNKYTELNIYFLEVLDISKQQTLNQLSKVFNYTLNMVINTNIGIQKNQHSVKSNIVELNNEFKKRNAVILNLNNQIMPTLTNMIESINKLKGYNKLKKNTYLYDSDDDSDDNKEKVE